MYLTQCLLRIVQSALHFLLTGRPIKLNIISWLWEASSQAVINESKRFMYKYPPLSIASYLFTQLSELEQWRVNRLYIVAILVDVII